MVSTWYLYFVRTRGGALYTGIATDVERRLAEHRQGRGSKYLRSRCPLELVYKVRLGDQPLALRAEARIKRLSKAEKEALVTAAPDREKLLALLAVGTSGSRRSSDARDPRPGEGKDR